MEKREFSTKLVMRSVLANLFGGFGGSECYLRVAGEFVGISALRNIASECVRSLGGFGGILTDGIADADDADDLVRVFRRKLGGADFRRIVSGISARLRVVLEAEPNVFNSSIAELESFSELRDFYSMTECELRMLAFLVCCFKIDYFGDLCEAAYFNKPRRYKTDFIASALRIPPVEVVDALKSLKRKGVVECGGRLLPEIDDDVENYIFSYDGGGFAERFSSVLRPAKTFALSSFEIDPADINIVSRLLASGRGAHILLYGRAGCGKTEFAKSAAVSVGRKIFVPTRNESEKKSLNLVGIKSAVFASTNSKGIVLVDEADDFLETADSIFDTKRNLEKGGLNMFLDSVKTPVLWISNSIDGIDESTRRRFAYTLEFDGISDTQRRNVLESALLENGVYYDVGKELFEVAKQCRLSPAAISMSVEKAKLVSDGRGEFLDNAKRIARRCSRFLTGRDVSEELSVDGHFDAEILNTSPPVSEVVSFVESYGRACAREGRRIPLSMLFSGLAGSGKTQFGRYVAKLLGREILVKRLSDIKSPYVGETERNIAAAFRQASSGGTVLMIDEADSLFGDRRNAVRSWEISETNEILAQMESFDGVFICTTNLLGNFDGAAMRRFQWKVEFDAPTLDGRVKLFESYFGGRGISEAARSELGGMQGLCAGDFKTVSQRLRFDDAPDESKILESLRCELRYKKDKPACGRIGFS